MIDCPKYHQKNHARKVAKKYQDFDLKKSMKVNERTKQWLSTIETKNRKADCDIKDMQRVIEHAVALPSNLFVIFLNSQKMA